MNYLTILQNKFFLVGHIIFLSFISLPTRAQVLPDNTLGAESSVINSINELRDHIEGGATRGENLFHSFQEFSIGEGLQVYFASPEGIANIFSRVTGSNLSEIFGTLGVEGTANLFFLNPNGIIFGENASIDIGGSFIASTASSIDFADGTSFAVEMNHPNVSLTIEVPIGLGFGSNPGNITVQGTGNNLSIPIPEFNIIRDNRPVGIEVPSGQTLALVGGDIILEGGNLTAPEGRIELGSVGAGERVGFIPVSGGWQFNFDGVGQFQNINLFQESSLDTSGYSSGAIQVRGQKVNVLDGSAMLANTLGEEGFGGGISIKSNVLELSGVTSDRFVSVIASDNINGTGGDISIETKQLYMADGSQIRAIVFGSGTTGGLDITARDIEVTGINPLNFDYLTSINSTIAIESSGGTGKDLTIDTKNLLVSGGGRILTDTFGFGEAGNLIINAESIELVEFKNRNLDLLTGLSTSARKGSRVGNAGNMIINTDSLKLINGARIRANALSNGNGGNITINAQNIELSGVNPLFQRNTSSISTSTENLGNGGNININTGILRLADGARIDASTQNTGNAGNIDITANSVELIGVNTFAPTNVSRISTSVNRGSGTGGEVTINTDRLKLVDGAQIRAFTFGFGDAGNINLDSREIEITGINPLQRFRASNISSASASPGAGGDITIKTENLRLADGARISAEAFDRGNAGNINITATDFTLTGANPFFPNELSGMATSVSDGSGTGGDITITTDRLQIAGGSQIKATTIGSQAGQAGSIDITAQDVEIIGVNPFDPNRTSNIVTASISPGDAGNTNIKTENLRIADGARIEAAAFSSGQAGSITITADNLNNSNGLITATAEQSGGGEININTNQLNLNNQGEISTSVFRDFGNGGNITINTDTFTALNNSQVTANAVRGNGGNITINTEGYFVSDDFIISASSEFGLDGIITINALDNDFQKDLEQSSIDFAVVELNFAESCLVRSNRERRSFVVGGTGGFPLSPDSEYIDTNQTLTGIGSLPSGTNLSPKSSEFEFEDDTDWQPGDPIIPADKMIVTEDGRTLLVASPQKAKDLICQPN